MICFWAPVLVMVVFEPSLNIDYCGIKIFPEEKKKSLDIVMTNTR